MPKNKIGASRRVGPADPSSAAGGETGFTQALVGVAATIGVIAASAAVLEAVLIPGIVIGGAAVLAPKYLPGLGRRLRPLFSSTSPRRTEPEILPPGQPDVTAASIAPARFTIRQAIAKAITFRIIVTTLDFSVNYVVIGELATAAGLSAFALVVGPLFYLAHETAWNRFGVSGKRVDITAFLRLRPHEKASLPARGRFTISRALAKTITFRTIATTMDFTTNFVVVGDLATAAALSASGFILGPFVYLGHEMVWDHYSSPGERTLELPAPTRLLAPA